MKLLDCMSVLNLCSFRGLSFSRNSYLKPTIIEHKLCLPSQHIGSQRPLLPFLFWLVEVCTCNKLSNSGTISHWSSLLVFLPPIVHNPECHLICNCISQSCFLLTLMEKWISGKWDVQWYFLCARVCFSWKTISRTIYRDLVRGLVTINEYCSMMLRL